MYSLKLYLTVGLKNVKRHATLYILHAVFCKVQTRLNAIFLS